MKHILAISDHLHGRLAAIAKERKVSVTALAVTILEDGAKDFEQQQDGMEVRKED